MGECGWHHWQILTLQKERQLQKRKKKEKKKKHQNQIKPLWEIHGTEDDAKQYHRDTVGRIQNAGNSIGQVTWFLKKKKKKANKKKVKEG